MTGLQSDIIAMAHDVHTLLAQAPEIAAIPAMAGKPAKLRALLTKADRLFDTQRSRITASIARREVASDAMIEATLAVAGIALSYAHDNNLPDLAAEVRVTAGDFRRNRLQHRVRLAQQIHAAVTPFVPQLAADGVTAETLDDLQDKIDAAAAALPATRGSAADKKAATAQLRETIREIRLLLKDGIDPLVRPLRQTNPDFYERYRARRTIINRAGGRPGSLPPPDAAAATPAAAPATPNTESRAA